MTDNNTNDKIRTGKGLDPLPTIGETINGGLIVEQRIKHDIFEDNSDIKLDIHTTTHNYEGK